MPGPALSLGSCPGSRGVWMLLSAAAPGFPAVALFASGGILSIPSSLQRSYTTSNYTSPQQLASKLTL